MKNYSSDFLSKSQSRALGVDNQRLMLFFLFMQELSVYPEKGAMQLEPDSMVSVKEGDSFIEKMASQLKTGDVYTTKINRQMHKRTVKQCIEELVDHKISITYKFFPISGLVLSHLTKGEIVHMPIDEGIEVEDLQQLFNYVLDYVQEDEL